MFKQITSIQNRIKPCSRYKKFALLMAVPAYFLAAGLALQPIDGIWQGLITIIREPDFLITDYIELGGVGAALINASFLTFAIIAMVYLLGMEVDGHTITACFLMFGFSLFGKNILNIWMILLGVWLYARYHKTSIRNFIYIGFYGTCLSPIITQIMQVDQIPVLLRFPLSLVIGIIIGFVLPPLSTHLHDTHKGYSLYNVGFSSGIIATVIVSLLKSFNIETETRLLWSTGNNRLFIILLSIFFGAMVVAALIPADHAFNGYRNILKSHGRAGTDFVKEHGVRAVLLNMGINGFVSMAFVVLAGGDLNGPTIGGIFTIVGFSATGKHLRNIIPIMLGVILAGFIKNWNISDPGPMQALLFSTTLAPIAGEFGVLAGILAGFLHSSVALNVGIIYGGMNLYNNGFAGGIIAAFLVPIIFSIKDRKARAKEDLSL